MTERAAANAAIDVADATTRQRLLEADAGIPAAQEQARELVRQARQARADAITRAIEEDGWTLARIAEVYGVTHQRVHQMRQGR
jgi:hypothetical protein